MNARLKDLTLGMDGRQIVSFTTDEDFRPLLDGLKDKDLDLTVAPRRKKRSLSANAYAWVLIDKIAQATRQKKSDVYRAAIREIGGVSDTLTMLTAAVEAFARRWAMNGDGWQAEVISEAKTPGYTHVRAYYGSSAYDTVQMSALIESLVQDAQALGIDTMTPTEREQLMAAYEARYGKAPTD